MVLSWNEVSMRLRTGLAAFAILFATAATVHASALCDEFKKQGRQSLADACSADEMQRSAEHAARERRSGTWSDLVGRAKKQEQRGRQSNYEAIMRDLRDAPSGVGSPAVR
jgi:hypothetical protein